MTPTLKTRKPGARLTASDLRAFPVWVLDPGQAGTRATMKPSRRRPDFGWEMLAADFTSSSGEAFFGFMAHGIIFTGGALFVRARRIRLPHEACADWARKLRKRTAYTRAKEAVARELGKRIDEVFPLRWRLRARDRHTGRRAGGTID